VSVLSTQNSHKKILSDCFVENDNWNVKYKFETAKDAEYSK
jgi:hypothetical protein